jgi:hypothetical protein
MPRRRGRLSVLLLVALGAGVLWYQWEHRDELGFSKPQPVATAPATALDDNARVAALFAAHRSDEVVEITGRVVKLLDDDDEGDRHQRFLLQVGEQPLLLLVAHNIDLAPRVPLTEGDELRLRGEYEWSEKGGVLHWTHRNPARNPRHEGGFIQLGGKRYE